MMATRYTSQTKIKMSWIQEKENNHNEPNQKRIVLPRNRERMKMNDAERERKEFMHIAYRNKKQVNLWASQPTSQGTADRVHDSIVNGTTNERHELQTVLFLFNSLNCVWWHLIASIRWYFICTFFTARYFNVFDFKFFNHVFHHS